MSKKLYPVDDINDLIEEGLNPDSFYGPDEEIEKGGVGSGVRGHKTIRQETGAIKNRKTGKMVPTSEFYEHARQQLMNYSGFDDRPGHFTSVKQVANAIGQATGYTADQAYSFAQDMIRSGRVERIGSLFVVMKKTQSSKNPDKDARIKENDAIIANHPVKTSKNSPTGG